MSAPQVGDIVRYTPIPSGLEVGPRSNIWKHREESGQLYVVVQVVPDAWYAEHYNCDAVWVYEPPYESFDSTMGRFCAPAKNFTVVSAASHPADAVEATRAREVRS